MKNKLAGKYSDIPTILLIQILHECKTKTHNDDSEEILEMQKELKIREIKVKDE